MDTGRERWEGDDGVRNVYTGIYWMLTKEEGTGAWIRNVSPHIHFHHAGGVIRYHLVHRETKEYRTALLGSPLHPGAEPQLVVDEQWYKSSELVEGDWALIGEGVAPGFEAREVEFPTAEQLGPEGVARAGHLLRAPDKSWADHYEK